MHLLRVAGLPDEALAAAADFHARILPDVLALPAQPILLVFGPADHTHRDWRVAVVRQLARQFAPQRINAVAGGSEAAIAAASRYLAAAEGVTGQYLPLENSDENAILPMER